MKISIRPNDTIVAIVSISIPPFGSGISVLEQTSAGLWSTLGTSPLDAIGDTTQSILPGDIDVTATETVASWNKGTCNALPRFVGKAPA